jgi:pyrroline-5-carboxylate reductase
MRLVDPGLYPNCTLITRIGNLGTPILASLITATESPKDAHFNKYIACVHNERSQERLVALFPRQIESGELVIYRGDNVEAVDRSDIVILGVDPSQVEAALKQDGIVAVLKGKLLISVAAGWSRKSLENLVCANTGTDRTWVLRTLPNVAAQVSQSMTAIEDPAEGFPDEFMRIADAMLSQVGKTVNVPPRLMNATTAVSGSTPAFWAVICDAFIDAAVAVGLPRHMAQAQIYQSMKGTAEMLQSGVHPGMLKDQGTSSEGCTIGGLMVLEEAGVRGHLGKALREAVTIARLMESGKEDLHVNDTRQS